MKDRASYWRIATFDGLEMLKAHYVHQRFPLHFHDSFCIGIMEQGIEILEMNGQKLTVPADAIILINPNEVHANYAFSDTGWHYRMMYINSEVLSYYGQFSIAGKKTTFYFSDHVVFDPALHHTIFTFHALCEKSRGKQVQTLFSDMLVKLINRFGAVGAVRAVSQTKDISVSAALWEVRQIIEQHSEENLKLEKLAQIARLDKFTFIRQFKKAFGIPPYSYLVMHRIEKSKKYLLEQMPLSHAALEAGFYDQCHFSHYFKKYTGVSPAVYADSCNILQDKGFAL